MGIHTNARPTVEQAVAAVLKRKPTLAELQYVQAFTHGESTYGASWPGTNNWGAVQSTARPTGTVCPPGTFYHLDSFPDGSKYDACFLLYPTPLAGATDAARHALILRPRVAEALRARVPSVMRTSLAMRRERYYGGFCPAATKAFGAQTAKDSFPLPDRDAGTKACEREAVEGHAGGVWKRIQAIAAELGEKPALGLGTFDDAYSWWHGGGGYSNVGSFLAALLVGGAAAGGAYYLHRRGWGRAA